MLAIMEIIKDVNNSNVDTPFLYQFRGGNKRIVTYILTRCYIFMGFVIPIYFLIGSKSN